MGTRREAERAEESASQTNLRPSRNERAALEAEMGGLLWRREMKNAARGHSPATAGRRGGGVVLVI